MSNSGLDCRTLIHTRDGNNLSPEDCGTIDLIKGQFQRIQRLIEAKAWPELAGMVAASHALINGHPKPLSELLDIVRAHSDTVANLQFLLRDIVHLEVSAQRALIRATYRLFWDVGARVKDRSADLDVTVEASGGVNGRWAATHLGVQVRPVQVRSSHGNASSAGPAAAMGGVGIPVYCINMQRSTARREHMARQFSRLGCDWKFVSAVDAEQGLDLSTLVRRDVLRPDHSGLIGPMSPTEVACALSHERAWRMMMRAGQSMALICEDDVGFPDPVIDLERLRGCVPRNCDILYFFYLNGDSATIVSPAIDRGSDAVGHVGSYAIFPAWACGGTQCYLLTASGAAKILKAFRPIRTAVDGVLSRLSATGELDTYALRPMAVSHADFPSTIR